MPVLNYQSPPESPYDLRAVANRQRAVNLCVLAYILVAVGRLVAPPQIAIYVALVGLAVVLTAVVFVFMLATQIYSTGLGILLGVLTLVPLVGLIVLLVVNGKATRILRAHGIPVGLLGARAPV